MGSIIFFASCKTTKKNTIAPAPKVITKPEEKSVEQPKPVSPGKLSIALLLPLELQKNLNFDTTDSELKSGTLYNLQFYEGFMLAVDSLRKKGKEISITTYDSGIDSISFINLFYKKDVMASNYIVCNANTNFISAASQVALKHHNKILFAQPVMQNNIVKENKDAWLALPANYTQSALMASYLATKYPDARFSIIYRENGREKTWANYFSDELLKGKVTDVQSRLYSKNLTDSIAAGMNKNKTNIFLIPSSDEAFVSPLISKLNEAGMANVIAAGLPTWETFESIDFSSYKNVKTMYFTSTYFDEESFAVKSFQKCFFKNYHTAPSFNAYLGFDIGVYLAKTQFSNDNGIMPVLNYDFRQPYTNAGFENQYISVVGIEDYKVIRKN